MTSFIPGKSSKREHVHPKIIHDMAAHLYWALAEVDGIPDVNDAVLKSNGHCLLKSSFTSNVFTEYHIPSRIQQDVGHDIAIEAMDFVSREQNMNGIVYAEDAQPGRSPSAQAIQTKELNILPKEIIISGKKPESIGWLCLRHPLPAVIFSVKKPGDQVFVVNDTSVALGFQLPMFFWSDSVYKISDELFASTGVFQIPVPNADYGNRWRRVIQNSTCFMESQSFYDEKGLLFDINVVW